MNPAAAPIHAGTFVPGEEEGTILIVSRTWLTANKAASVDDSEVAQGLDEQSRIEAIEALLKKKKGVQVRCWEAGIVQWSGVKLGVSMIVVGTHLGSHPIISHG
jgi:hypothetical protein